MSLAENVCSMLASNFKSTRELEVKYKLCGFNCCVDFNQWNCNSQMVGKLTQKLGSLDTVNQPLVRFWYVKVQ